MRPVEDILADELEDCSTTLRLHAERWRRRVASGRLDQNLAGEAAAFVRRVEAALARLDGAASDEEVGRLLGEERFRLLVESVHDHALLMLDPDGRVASWNGGAEQILGYRASEVTGRHHGVFFPPEESAEGEPERHLEIASREGRHVDEGWRVRKDGSLFWASVVVTPMRDGRGRLRGYAKVVRDLTDGKEAEDRLQRAAERYRMAVESAPNAMVMVDRMGRIVLVNAQTERLFGYGREELLGQPVEILVPNDVRERHPGHRAAFMADPRTRAMGAGRDLFGRRKDGTEVPVEIGLNPFETQEGRFVLAAIVDITERKRAEERFRVAVEAAPNAMVMVSPQGRIVLVNAQTERLFGYPREELLGRSVETLVPERFRARHPAFRARFATSPHSRPMGAGRDLFGLRSDGTEVPIEIGLNPIHMTDGTYVLAAIVDITERKRAEQRLRDVLASVPGVVWEALGRPDDPRHRLTFVSEHAPQMLGWPTQALLDAEGGFWGRIVHPDDRDRAIGEATAAFLQTGPANTRFRAMARDGRDFWVEARMSPILDATGQPEGLRGVLLDVTETVQASKVLEERFRGEQAARAEAERARRRLTLLGEVSAILAASPGAIGRAVGALVPGLAEAAIVHLVQSDGRLAPVAVVGNERAGPYQRVWLADEAAENGPAAAVWAGRSIREAGPPSVVIAPLRVRGSTLGALTLVSDERAFVADDLALAEEVADRIGLAIEKERFDAELQRANVLESIGVLAGGIAHDFNNLLTGILANVSMARATSDPERAAARLDAAEKAGTRARDLTQQLLTFSKGGSPIRRRASLRELIGDWARFVLAGSNVGLDLDVDPDLWVVEVDVAQISQVVQNLVLNAQQAMPGGGTVSVEARNVRVDTGSLPVEAGPYVRIRVRDHGVGISPEHLARMFEPFFTTKPKGSGLGLATAYGIVQKHDGHITAQSEPHTGSVFTVWLPASEGPPEAAATPEPAARGHGRILLMDDDEAVRDVAAAILTDLGYDVQAVNDGQQAIAAYEAAVRDGAPFDAVLLDLTVPGGMGGQQALAHLRQLDPAVRAIVSSGWSADPIMSSYREHGFADVVSKPYTAAEMAAVVRRVVGGPDQA